MLTCEECGSDNVRTVQHDGTAVLECALCGTLVGDDAAVAALLLEREARVKGIDPGIYPLVVTLRKLSGLHVVAADGGDPGARVWPFVQIAPLGAASWKAVENVVKSLALSAREHEVHWVLEVEYQTRLVLTLKPRFHRGVAEITPELVEAARRDLGRVCRALETHMNLSWWHRSD